MPPSQVLTVEHHGPVATVWLDRPEARNAMGPEFFDQLPAVMSTVSSDRDVRAVVLAARGRDFSVGLDLKAMAGLLTGTQDAPRPGGEAPAHGGAVPPDAGRSRGGPSGAARAAQARAGILQMQRSITAVADCPKPVIAAIHGYCIGGGVDLVTAADIRLASEDALLSVREVRMAIVADLGTLQRLPRIVGKGHVAELAFTGKDLTARRAAEIGLVNDVLADATSTVAAAQALAQDIAANSPVAVQGTKAVLAACEDRSVADGLDYVAAWNAGFLQSDDLVEAVAAFLDKRAPRFEGR